MEDASILTAEILLSFSANPELIRSKDSIAHDALVIARFQPPPLTGDRRADRQPGQEAHTGRPVKGSPDQRATRRRSTHRPAGPREAESDTTQIVA